MAIVYNNKQIQHAYYGETPIHQIYLGDQLKWADVGCGTGRNMVEIYPGVGDTTQRTVFTQSGPLSNNWVKAHVGISFSCN